jgi:hypothetical protein
MGCLPLTEPAWTLQVTVKQAPSFPFREADVIPIGKGSMPGAGEFVPLTVGARAREAGFQGAWILGAGHFAIAAGGAPVALPASEPLNSGTFDGMIEPGGWRLESSASERRVVLVRAYAPGGTRIPDQPLSFLRVTDGHGVASGPWIERYSAPENSVPQIEFATFSLARVASDEVELAWVKKSPPATFDFTFVPPKP